MFLRYNDVTMDDGKNVPSDPFGVQIESILNKDDGSLPFGYFEPSQDGKLTWNCGYDAYGKIISIFCFDFGSHKDKKIAELPSINDAIYARDQLIAVGWRKLKAPEITVTYADGEKKALTRKQKRYLARKMQKMSKQNPFDGEDGGAGSPELGDDDEKAS